MYDADGGIVATENHENWDYYFGQYLYTVQLAQTMIDRILQAADELQVPLLELRPVGFAGMG